eukprot:CAMPEP_0172533862 /NCGR_PEP_ID=MMETSP1067-20121228/6429_1 /TAXON_ID=265564 ORGANISM="Thalassiosira punctigera, Strain Tpunct2005C2" /NCGR_SAMPLE_ID=MMETSP1067 /ASSEMBLY_ACC=CAM_ASM_000444 /LENGTH=359 /DNA_ID=CAMNT_0013318571 /DNA_START=132 /DNA_END=1208 /DNA_ORIENTATION=+
MNFSEQALPKLIISFRGVKYDDFKWTGNSSLSDLKIYLSTCTGEDGISVKFIHKGKLLTDDDSANLYSVFAHPSSKQTLNGSAKPIRLMAMGATAQESKRREDAFRQAELNSARVRDDLSTNGKAEIAARQRLGRTMLQKASWRDSRGQQHTAKKYGFHRIEILPMLPEKQRAEEILQSLANDPGILACMEKHRWNVGCLAELYPEGKVGESEVCVMGLNQNKGQKILLRLRTDDLKGFRKVLSIRRVLFHELAHNIHSEHNGEFFQLMRQIEKECNELDWRRDGRRLGGLTSAYSTHCETDSSSYAGGTYVLGSNNNHTLNESRGISKRELIARATEMRLTEEEQQIQDSCGCFQESP